MGKEKEREAYLPTPGNSVSQTKPASLADDTGHIRVLIAQEQSSVAPDDTCKTTGATYGGNTMEQMSERGPYLSHVAEAAVLPLQSEQVHTHIQVK